MPNDQFGRPVAVGDTVTIKGEVVKILDDPNYINCTVKLAQQMPPSGAEVNIELNTAQVEKAGDGGGAGKQGAEKSQAGANPPPAQPPHGTGKK